MFISNRDKGTPSEHFVLKSAFCPTNVQNSENVLKSSKMSQMSDFFDFGSTLSQMLINTVVY